MSQNLKFAAVAYILCLAFCATASALESQEISWDDLVPAESEFDDPFTKLDEDTLYELTLVAMVHDEIARGDDVDQETMSNHETRIENLKDSGVDVEGLIGMREEVIKDREAKLALTNKELDGKVVRIPGYLLPLEFDENKVTEFFLVPYVGACIHTPPPPPNQIVHVSVEGGYTSFGDLYTPIWVDGIIRSEQKNSNLSYVDGAADIPSGYMIDAINIELYEQ